MTATPPRPSRARAGKIETGPSETKNRQFNNRNKNSNRMNRECNTNKNKIKQETIR